MALKTVTRFIVSRLAISEFDTPIDGLCQSVTANLHVFECPILARMIQTTSVVVCLFEMAVDSLLAATFGFKRRRHL